MTDLSMETVLLTGLVALFGPGAVIFFMRKWFVALQASWESKLTGLEIAVSKLQGSLDTQRKETERLTLRLVQDFATKEDTNRVADRVVCHEARLCVIEHDAEIRSRRHTDPTPPAGGG